MNQRTLESVKKIDAIIRKIRVLQGEVFSSFTDCAIENLKLVRLQVVIDGANRDRLDAERQETK